MYFACCTIDGCSLGISAIALVISGVALCFQWKQKNNDTRLSLIEPRFKIRNLYAALSEGLRMAVAKNSNNLRNVEDAGTIATEWFYILEKQSLIASLIPEGKDIFSGKQEFGGKVRDELQKVKYLFESSRIHLDVGAVIKVYDELEYYASSIAGGIGVLGDKVRDLDVEMAKRNICQVLERSQGAIEMMDNEMVIR